MNVPSPTACTERLSSRAESTYAANAFSTTMLCFVTMSTTGYGDLVPAVGVPRALAIAEAMVGQLYLVSVVAVAVSRMAARERVRG